MLQNAGMLCILLRRMNKVHKQWWDGDVRDVLPKYLSGGDLHRE